MGQGFKGQCVGGGFRGLGYGQGFVLGVRVSFYGQVLGIWDFPQGLGLMFMVRVQGQALGLRGLRVYVQAYWLGFRVRCLCLGLMVSGLGLGVRVQGQLVMFRVSGQGLW